jgi:hypothetical protein
MSGEAGTPAAAAAGDDDAGVAWVAVERTACATVAELLGASRLLLRSKRVAVFDASRAAGTSLATLRAPPVAFDEIAGDAVPMDAPPMPPTPPADMLVSPRSCIAVRGDAAARMGGMCAD